MSLENPLDNIDQIENEYDFENDNSTFTPAKYNGGQLDIDSKNHSSLSLVEQCLLNESLHNTEPLKYVVGVDWCELSLRGDLSYLNKAANYVKKDFAIYRTDIQTRLFTNVYNVYYRGCMFGTLLFGVRSAALPVELIQFKIDNQYFYKDLLPGRLSKTVKQFLDAYDLTFNNYTRLDIYIDFHKFNPLLSFQHFVNLYSVGQIETKGKITKWNPFYSKIGGKMELTGFSMGSRSSEKYVRCYNKTLEIEQSHKQYIPKFWDLNGLDSKQTIYRFEIQLSGKFFNSLKVFRDFEPIEVNGREYPAQSQEVLHKLLSINPSTVVGLFDVAMKNYFEFFIEDKQKKRNDDKIPFEVFNWQYLIQRVKNSYRFVKQRLRHKSFTWRQKMIVARNIFREYIFSKQSNKWLINVTRIIQEYELESRWQKMLERYVNEFMMLAPYQYEFDFGKYQSHWSTNILEIKKELSESTQTNFLTVLADNVETKKRMHQKDSLYMLLTTPEQRLYYEEYTDKTKFKGIDFSKWFKDIQNIL